MRAVSSPPAVASRAVLWTIVLLVVACGRTPGSGYAAIDKLPDWSGHWTANAAQTVGPAAEAASGRDHGTVPFTEHYLALRAKGTVVNGDVVGGNMVKCLPSGMPGLMRHGNMFEFLFTPGLVTMLFEDGEVRRIYTDGRGHPAAEDLYVNWNGHSVGHWEGNTLVVDTIGMKTESELFMTGELHPTREMHVMERMTRTGVNTFRVETTLTDPNVFTKSYNYAGTYETVEGVDMPDADNCVANTRDNGATVDLTPPGETR